MSPEPHAEALEKLGRHIAQDREPLSRPAIDREAVRSVLARDDLSNALEEAAVRLVQVLASDPVDRHEVESLLSTRDRAECELLGAAFVLDVDPEILAAWSPARTIFDALVRPECWRLVAFNELRQEKLRAIAARHRGRFYWWSDGAGIDPSAASALAAAAQLVAASPRARERFESLVKAQIAWTERSQGIRPVMMRPTTLRAWLSRTAADTLPLAAAGGDEHTVLATSVVELSFAPPNRLILDLLSDRAADAVPSLRTESGRVLVVEAVEGAEERFVSVLPLDVLDDGGTRLTLSVSLSEGTLEVLLPPANDE